MLGDAIEKEKTRGKRDSLRSSGNFKIVGHSIESTSQERKKFQLKYEESNVYVTVHSLVARTHLISSGCETIISRGGRQDTPQTLVRNGKIPIIIVNVNCRVFLPTRIVVCELVPCITITISEQESVSRRQNLLHWLVGARSQIRFQTRRGPSQTRHALGASGLYCSNRFGLGLSGLGP